MFVCLDSEPVYVSALGSTSTLLPSTNKTKLLLNLSDIYNLNTLLEGSDSVLSIHIQHFAVQYMYLTQLLYFQPHLTGFLRR